MFLPLCVDPLLLYVCPCGGEFVGGGNVESIFQSIIHDTLNLTLTQNHIKNSHIVNDASVFTGITGADEQIKSAGTGGNFSQPRCSINILIAEL